MVMWILIGLAAAFTLSFVTGLAVAAVLGAIGRSVSEPLEFEPWASAPLTRGEHQASSATASRVASRASSGS
jgi:hypothetical protein